MEAKALAGESAASLYPSLSGTADASRSRSPGTERKNAPPFSATTANNFDLGLSASYMVDFWGRYRDMAEAGKLSVTASEYDRDTTRLSTVAALANAYFQLLATQDRLRLARQNLPRGPDGRTGPVRPLQSCRSLLLQLDGAGAGDARPANFRFPCL